MHKRPETAWSNAQAKLADFGLAERIEEGEQHASGVGTDAYRAPEVRDGRYYPETDVYALGKTMEELKRESIAPLFRTQSEELTGWVNVQKACLAVGRPHSERLSAANVRTRLRELLPSTVQPLASQPAPITASDDAEAAPPALPRDVTVYVFVGSTARIQDKQPNSRRGRHYHSHQACHRSVCAPTSRPYSVSDTHHAPNAIAAACTD